MNESLNKWNVIRQDPQGRNMDAVPWPVPDESNLDTSRHQMLYVLLHSTTNYCLETELILVEYE
jgi:hypothetical protein